jgi:hypothetical protein
MAQVVCHRPLTAEAWVRAQFSPCEFYGGQSGTGTGFTPNSLVFPCQCLSAMALDIHISHGG